MITQERLKELLDYNPETGVFTRLISVGGQKVGSIAGTLRKDGYMQIRADGNRYYAHQLAFLFMEGYLPEIVDHINRIRNDNRWVNLRESNSQKNNRNRNTKNKSGYLGVFWDTQKQKWRITVRDSTGKNIHGGYFNYLDLRLAVQRANELRLKLHGPDAILETFNPTKLLPTLEEINNYE